MHTTSYYDRKCVTGFIIFPTNPVSRVSRSLRNSPCCAFPFAVSSIPDDSFFHMVSVTPFLLLLHLSQAVLSSLWSLLRPSVCRFICLRRFFLPYGLCYALPFAASSVPGGFFFNGLRSASIFVGEILPFAAHFKCIGSLYLSPPSLRRRFPAFIFLFL